MNVFIITCAGTAPPRRAALLAALAARASCLEFPDGSTLAASDDTAEALYGALVPFTIQDDSLYVLPVTRPYRGFGRREVNLWLDRHLAGGDSPT